ncbi:MAG TPA: zinc dependent phospholipase C family protein [Parafilimonas sp.]|jgi:hypothetical protein
MPSTHVKLPLLLLFLIPFRGNCLGVLTHEAIIDAEWDKTILPFLKFKYPASTDSEFTAARAYAYGGAVTPDMGYYPFGSKLFTNLVHYVRSGDMDEALLKDADSLNGLAFALGFLSHYYADVYGHPLATNVSVPVVYKKMQKKFGDTVTYADDKISHIRMEFGFDVLQTARGNYASKSYHDFIGFKVDTALLARAFSETYGLNLDNVFNNHLNLSVETFRFMIASVFPLITRAAWASKNKKFFVADTTKASQKFRYKMHIKQYNKDFGTGYKRPGFFPAGLAVIIKIMPKVGPLRALHFKIPNAQTEKYFDESFDTITMHYTHDLSIAANEKAGLKDKDYDTGYPTEKCEYVLADETYNEWLLQLNSEQFKNITPSIKSNIAQFYKQVQPAPQGRRYKECAKVYAAFNALKQVN